MLTLGVNSASFCRARPICVLLRKGIGYSSHEMEKGAEDPVVGDPENPRDISGLPKEVRQRMEKHAGPLTYNEGKYPQGSNRSILRMWYARHGQKTGIDPSIAYPTKQELREIIEEENEFEPTLQERWAELEARKTAEAEKRRKQYVSIYEISQIQSCLGSAQSESPLC